ncbi:hypothetical protein GCM10009775_04160 [Microbacterium aoyamense]|uniref:Uncharacterized protein n=1 Tax=Microbacterium aoyamense TaxID=344166 RepID=A0ABN2P8D7_9MICO
MASDTPDSHGIAPSLRGFELFEGSCGGEDDRAESFEVSRGDRRLDVRVEVERRK